MGAFRPRRGRKLRRRVSPAIADREAMEEFVRNHGDEIALGLAIPDSNEVQGE